MKILVINAGSSSLKYQVIDSDTEAVLAKGLCERIGIEGSKLTHKVPGKEDFVNTNPMPTHVEAVAFVMEALLDAEHGILKSLDEIGAIGHRVVHGGQQCTESCIVTEEVKGYIRDNFDLAPLHNPANLMGIEACEKNMPGKPNTAVFDTAFGTSMDAEAYMYAIPYEYYEKYQLRRYGFHGTSHKFVQGETVKFANLPEDKRKIIVCHLGNGASVSASINGKCVDTSMGLTPLEGLIMGTRSGDLDPAIVQFIANHENMDADGVLNVLNKKSGVLGISGVSSDFRDLSAAEAEGNERAGLALKAYRHRLLKYIGGYTALMNGVDAISFTAGLGENDAEVRSLICAQLGYLGIKIDEEKNKQRGKAMEISTPDSAVKVFVIPTNEELAIARDTLALVTNA
ncbi:MAG: acetate kinase [Lachnospiraceae bacterium]|nr:acetate kinase [Candidatus Equihabitans merdae]